MKNQNNTLILAGVAVLAYVLYKKYTTTIGPAQNMPTQAQITAAANYNPGLEVPNIPGAAPITAPAVMPSQPMALTFDTIQNF